MANYLLTSPHGRRYGLYRDNAFSPARSLLALRAPAQLQLPARATTSQWMGKIRDQGQEGSCTGQLGAEYRDALYRKLYLFEKEKNVAPSNFMASAAFVYLCNLIAGGELGQDVGSTIHQTFITLNQKGVCLESEEPYTDTNYSKSPSDEQYKEALIYQGGAYHFLPSLKEIKASIASGYSVGMGIDVYDSFEGSELAKTGFMPMPAASEKLLGGHAQHAMDYDDEIKFPDGSHGGVFVQNSWGSEWGISAAGCTDRGGYWMPYAYFDEHVRDAWMMHLGPAW
jgi:C1A family cysteine protease